MFCFFWGGIDILSSLGESPPQKRINVFFYPSPIFFHFLPFAFPSFITHAHLLSQSRSTIDPLTGTREVTAFTPIINEDYNSTTDKNDIGVAILGAFSKYPPLRIQTPELSTLTEAGKPLTVVGWGSMVSAKL